MKFRRKSDPAPPPEPTAPEEGEPAADAGTEAVPGADTVADPGADPAAETGAGPSLPRDSGDVDDAVERVDLGSLRIEARPERELRLQVDEATQAVQAVLLVGSDGALEVRAFAAPRHGDLWTEVRPRIVEETVRAGGTAEEREGRYGTELVCQRPATAPDGRTGVQASRVVGINGERWLLRATFVGRPATEPDVPEWEDTLAAVVVHRGAEAMPPGEALPLQLPSQARRLS